MFSTYPCALSICRMPTWAYSVKDQHKGDGRGNVGLKIIILVIAICEYTSLLMKMSNDIFEVTF